jgi:ligand-binding sensor domain-containing protein/two-component sensor histidine kinase
MRRFFLLLAILSSGFLYAQKELVFKKMTKQDRLASSQVNYVLKDHSGYYWISSLAGLQRFDGRRMLSFQHDPGDPHSLPDNSVGIIMEDNQHRLWLNTNGNPCLFDPVTRSFKKIPVEINKESYGILSFFQDKNGSLWMTTLSDGFFVFDTTKNVFRSYTLLWPECFGLISYVAEDRQTGNFWLSTSKGVALYDPQKRVYYHNGNNPQNLQCFNDPVFRLMSLLYKDDNNGLWIQFWNPGPGFMHYRYDLSTGELIYISQYTGVHFWGFISDGSGTTWAYGSKLGRYDPKARAFIDIVPQKNSLYGIDFNDIFNMSSDSENNLWLMTNLGLYSFNARQRYFTTYSSASPGLSKEKIGPNTNSFIETRDGTFISLSWGGDGLYFYDSAFNRVPPKYGYKPAAPGDNHLLTWCGLQDSKGIIWIGCQHGAIIQLDPSKNKMTRLNPPQFGNRTIRSIAEDKNGNLWFGTQHNILVKWERSSNTYKQVIDSSKEKYNLGWVLRLVPGNENDIWAATLNGGLLHIDCDKNIISEQFLPVQNDPAGISSENIREIIKWSNDTLAVLTAKGIDLFLLRTKQFSHINSSHGLPPEGITSMIKDQKNNLWFSSLDGISKIHLPDKRVYHYGSADGITEQDFQLASVHQLQNGKIVFGNTTGFVAFDPAGIKETALPSDVRITGIRIFDSSIHTDSLFRSGNRMRLRYSQNYIAIQFSSLSNITHNNPDYLYMLEGLDKNWIKANENQEAVYTYLPPGDYTFKVKAISRDGIESNNITSFGIHITPPFYKAWWFLVLLALLVGAVCYYIYTLRMKRRREREIIRNRIARDLHDDMGSTLSTISILSSMAKSKLNTDEIKAGEYINKISDNSQRMMEAMDDIVWAIKPDNDSMQKLVARMREFATNVLEAKDIEIDFYIDPGVSEIKLDMEQRRDLFLVFKEAVNNVAKYSKCKKATVQLGKARKRLVLMVKDDGIGFDIKAADTGNGLGNMQKRADALKGRLQFQTKPRDGTAVILNIPIDK